RRGATCRRCPPSACRQGVSVTWAAPRHEFCMIATDPSLQNAMQPRTGGSAVRRDVRRELCQTRIFATENTERRHREHRVKSLGYMKIIKFKTGLFSVNSGSELR